MAEQFEQIKDQKDAQIASLKKDTQSLSSQITYLQDENESLRKTIENNLYKQVESEKALREEIEKLKKEIEKKNEVLDLSEENVTEKPQTKKRAPKISAIFKPIVFITFQILFNRFLWLNSSFIISHSSASGAIVSASSA